MKQNYSTLISKGEIKDLSTVPFHKSGPIERTVFAGGELLNLSNKHVAVHNIEKGLKLDDLPDYCLPHKHNHPEINLLLSDNKSLKYKITLGDEVHIISSPSMVYIPAGLTHSANVISGNGYFIVILDCSDISTDIYGPAKFDFFTEIDESSLPSKVFDKRSEYYEKESVWAVSEDLNKLCEKLLLSHLQNSQEANILDYGAGTGAFSRLLRKKVHSIDIADISKTMLKKCEHARYRFLIPRDNITNRYDAIILRQVLHYYPENNWNKLMLGLRDILKENGFILISQMVPYGDIDMDFWRQYTKLRRPERKSFPTTDSIIKIIRDAGLVLTRFDESTTYNSLNTWCQSATNDVKLKLLNLFSNASNEVKSLKNITIFDDDLQWRSKWVHYIAKTNK